jgi:hypothetical protein
MRTSSLTESTSLIADFFQRSTGNWRSERRYYTLPKGNIMESISLISVKYLPQGCDELKYLAQLHNLPDHLSLLSGSEVVWNTTELHTGKQLSEGTTIFGVTENEMFRDRGYATLQPVIATYRLPNTDTLQLRTEYNGSIFEEEIRLVGTQYRTRQTIVTKAGEQQLVGQYLETRQPH